MNVLVINCGSSSLKFQLIQSETEKVMAKGVCERIGIEGSRIVYQPENREKMTKEVVSVLKTARYVFGVNGGKVKAIKKGTRLWNEENS